MIPKAIQRFFFMIPWVLVFLLLHVLYFLDHSIQPPSQLSQNHKKIDVHLISYADGPMIFAQNQNMLAMSAINRGVDFIYNYRRHHINPAFIQVNPILNSATGAGYWLWKPYLILETLKKIPQGDILIYGDTGLLFRQNIWDYFIEGLKNKDILLFAYNPKNYKLAGSIASGDVFDALACRSVECREGHHVWAGILVLRNSMVSRRFIQQWLTLCQNSDLLTGNKQHSANFPEFAVHQHDEALLSVLAAKNREKIAFLPIDKKFSRYMQMHRRKNNDISLLGHISIQYHYIERKLLNAKITKKLQLFLAKILEKPSKKTN